MRIIYLCIVSLFVASTSFCQKVDLKLNLLKGNTYYHNISGNTIITETVDGKEIIMDVALGGKTSFEITDIVDTVYATTVKYKSLRMKMSMQEKTYEFSSDGFAKEDKVSKLLAQLIDKPFSVKMTTKGKLIKVENIDTIFSNIINQYPELSTTKKQQLLQQLLNSYGEKAFEGNFNMLTAMFPTTKVRKGDKWVVTTNLESGMAATLETTYQLIEISDNYYEIRGESQLRTADKEAYKQINGMPAKYDLTGSMTTNIKISKHTGWIIEGKITQTMRGNVEIKDNSQIPGGMIIPMTYTGNITVTGN